MMKKIIFFLCLAFLLQCCGITIETLRNDYEIQQAMCMLVVEYDQYIKDCYSDSTLYCVDRNSSYFFPELGKWVTDTCFYLQKEPDPHEFLNHWLDSVYFRNIYYKEVIENEGRKILNNE